MIFRFEPDRPNIGYTMVMTFDRDTRRALLALTAAGLIWGLTVPLSKLALGWLDAAWLTVARFGIAAPLLALLARRHLRAAASVRVAAWGAVGFGLVVVLQNLAIPRTSVTHAAVILGTVPILVALTSAAAGRGAAGPHAWTGFAVALGGIALVAGSGGSGSASGDLLMLISAVLSALTIVAQARLLDGRDAIAVTAVQMGAAALVVLPLALSAGSLPSAPPLPAEAAATLALVTIGSLLPFALYAYGQARVSPEIAGAFVNLEPLVGAALGAMVFGDPFGRGHAAGTIAILAGIALSVDWPRSQRGRG
jgi:drug/metabolite transporter (DMT)-like permease